MYQRMKPRIDLTLKRAKLGAPPGLKAYHLVTLIMSPGKVHISKTISDQAVLPLAEPLYHLQKTCQKRA